MTQRLDRYLMGVAGLEGGTFCDLTGRTGLRTVTQARLDQPLDCVDNCSKLSTAFI
jgi:hypothetical protein